MASLMIRKIVNRWRFLTIIGLGMLALTATGSVISWADEAGGIGTRAIATSSVKTLRLPAAGTSSEENLQRRFAPPARPGDLRALSSAELEQFCLKNPRCGQKLNQARQGVRSTVPLPAATVPSQEERFLKPQVPVPPAPGLLPPLGPRSHVPGPVERFLSWLNPFAVDLAWAQAPFSITLTPDRRSNPSPLAALIVSGAMVSPAAYSTLYNGFSTDQPLADNKPYIWVNVILPVAGYYLVDVVASPSLTKLRHWSSQTIDTWDDRAGCAGLSVCHHVTVDLYAAGGHLWYFWADPTVMSADFYSFTIKSYP